MVEKRSVVLVVEDDPAMATALTASLRARGYGVRATTTGAEAIATVTEDRPEVVVLDLGLPDLDGLEVCRRIREWSQVPIVVLTADGAEDRKVLALDSGADDYVTKPFSMRELMARLRVALRHGSTRVTEQSALLEVDDLIVNLAEHQVTLGSEPIELTPKEFDFLALLARYPGRVLTHRAILAGVWGPEGKGHVEYLRVYARSVRRKLGEEPGGVRILTEPGVGYRLVGRDGTIDRCP
jgi:two-component system KDP operon response regulator KdpE